MIRLGLFILQSVDDHAYFISNGLLQGFLCLFLTLFCNVFFVLFSETLPFHPIDERVDSSVCSQGFSLATNGLMVYMVEPYWLHQVCNLTSYDNVVRSWTPGSMG